jgi:hypothetical protein
VGTDFHHGIIEPDQGQEVVLTQLDTDATFEDLAPDDPNASSLQNLDLTGNPAPGNSADATLGISPFDPRAGITFAVAQYSPSLGRIPMQYRSRLWACC